MGVMRSPTESAPRAPLRAVNLTRLIKPHLTHDGTTWTTLPTTA